MQKNSRKLWGKTRQKKNKRQFSSQPSKKGWNFMSHDKDSGITMHVKRG